MHPVIATNPPAAYLGGKRNLAKRLCALIEATPHKVYIEPFVGMGGVFLRRDRAPAAEIINDLAGDVANLFRVIRRHYEPFVDEFTWLLSGRDEFERQRRIDPTTLTDDAVGALLAKAAVKAVTDWVTAQAADDRRLLYRRRLEDRAGRQDGAGL